MSGPQLPKFPWPYARPGSSFHCCEGTLVDDLWREFNECCDDPFWWNSGRGRWVANLLDLSARGDR
jgi:hypothetical protein